MNNNDADWIDLVEINSPAMRVVELFTDFSSIPDPFSLKNAPDINDPRWKTTHKDEIFAWIKTKNNAIVKGHYVTRHGWFINHPYRHYQIMNVSHIIGIEPKEKEM